MTELYTLTIVDGDGVVLDKFDIHPDEYPELIKEIGWFEYDN